MAENNIFEINTRGHCDVINITPQLEKFIQDTEEEGALLVFVLGTTAALTIIEYEEGIIKDLQEMLEKIAPQNFDYHHHKRWGDFNGAAHLRSALIGPSLVVPFKGKALQLGTWQQVVLVDFDEKPRCRQILIKILTTIHK
ncbi:YjbQ family protein [Candidatus Parcubacteria bacterium]|nr:MAG: YjbQ family protein [Candidatus Parcubacteria bacterium]